MTTPRTPEARNAIKLLGAALEAQGNAESILDQAWLTSHEYSPSLSHALQVLSRTSGALTRALLALYESENGSLTPELPDQATPSE